MDEIRKLRIVSRWQIREVWKILEWRDGCVFKTKSLGHILCPSDYKLPANYMITSVSTKVSMRLERR